jgi:retron-type reverse transcriptase
MKWILVVGFLKISGVVPEMIRVLPNSTIVSNSSTIQVSVNKNQIKVVSLK